MKEENAQVKADNLVVTVHLISFSKPHYNQRGYPYWDGHPAAALLEVDAANCLHKTKEPHELCATQKEYHIWEAGTTRGREVKDSSVLSR